MSEDLRRRFEQSLPKAKRISFATLFQIIGSTCSILGMVGALAIFKDIETSNIIYTSFMIFFVCVLIGYTIIRESSKEHNFSQSVYYVHYVNHVIRDYFGALENGDAKHIEDVIERILTAIMDCFSLVTGKPCRSCLKELKSENGKIFLLTSARDFKSRDLDRKEDEEPHTLEENTDFYNLWYAKNGCTRFYLCNNLVKEWKMKNYKNSSFKKVGNPIVKSFAGITLVSNWKLPYRSTVVLPIRFLKKFSPPDEKEDQGPPEWKFWGFLCIDCNSKRKFEKILAPELGLAFADLLYLFFSQANEKLGEGEEGKQDE